MECLGIESTPCVISIAGAGGKTTLMYALAREIVALGRTVVTTTTTKILPPKTHESPCVLLAEDDPSLSSLAEKLLQYRHVTVAHSFIPDVGKLKEVGVHTVSLCSNTAQYVVIEADGAAGYPIKAPQSWEPVIPKCTRLVIYMVGLECIGRSATDQWVFRLDRFLSLTGIKRGETICGHSVGRLLSHPQGALKGVPTGIPVIPFLNKRDLLTDVGAIGEIAATIVAEAGDRISVLVVGSLKEAAEI